MTTNTIQMAEPEERLYAFLANLGIGIVSLGIGWLIWSAFLWNEGTTPGHKLLNLSIVDEVSLQPLSWNQMALRELVYKGLLGSFLSTFTYGLIYIADGLFIFRDERTALHDLIAHSLVIKNQGASTMRVRF